jgi:hypothetical protein
MSAVRRSARLGFFCLLFALLGGCAALVPQTIALRTGWPAEVPQTVMLKDVPFFPQEDYDCGPATLAMLLSYTGVAIRPEALLSQVYVPSRHGSLQIEMLAAARRYDRVSYELTPRYPSILREVAAGNPVIVLQDVGPLFAQWHYAVLTGFDYPSGTLYFHSGYSERLEMPFTAFERDWMKSGYWAMVVTPPDRIPATATEDGWNKAVLAMARVAPGDAPMQAWSAALKRWPDNLPAAIGLANEYDTRGRFAEAVAVLRDAQQRHPESVIVMNNLAQALSDDGRQAEALALIDKASDPQGPFATEVRSTRALILQRLAQQKQ